jgi:hypothetical protein
VSARLEGFTTTTAVTGGNHVMKVREWHCYSEPSETYFEVRGRITTTQAQIQGIADGISATIEQLLTGADITDVSWSQDVTPSGQLQSVYTVYWRTGDGLKTGFVEVPVGQFNVDHVGILILEDMGPGTFLLA